MGLLPSPALLETFPSPPFYLVDGSLGREAASLLGFLAKGLPGSWCVGAEDWTRAASKGFQ